MCPLKIINASFNIFLKTNTKSLYIRLINKSALCLTYPFACSTSRQLLNGTSSESLTFSLRREKSQLLAFLVGQRMTVPNLIVVWRKLMKQLPYTIPFPGTVHIRDLILWDLRKVQMHLFWTQSRWHPGVFFECTSTIVVGL